MASNDRKGDAARSPHLPAAVPFDVPFNPRTQASVHPRILPFSEKAMAIAFGQMLKAARLRRALSQQDLAREAAMYRTNISLIECGRRSVRLPTICILHTRSA